MLYQRLDRRIAEQAYDWIINSLHDLFLWYTGDGDIRMQLDVDTKSAKESYYIAALIGALCNEMIEKGFSHHVFDSGYPYDFKKNNLNFSKAEFYCKIMKEECKLCIIINFYIPTERQRQKI